MVGIRPATPGTLVVLTGTILLVLVTVSAPISRSFYFLEATVGAQDITENIKFGVFGYCIGSKCTNVALGYRLQDVDKIFGISGLADQIGLDNVVSSTIRWITYALILHPIAGAFGVLSVLCGLVSHIREFSSGTFATCFATFAATFASLVFILDLALFIIMQKRINSRDVGGTATLGNALWMTLAAILCFAFSGCFFAAGRCIIRKRTPDEEKTKPKPDSEYGNNMRNDAMNYQGNQGYQGYQGYQQGFQPPPPPTTQGHSQNSLPVFQDKDGEIIPLTSMPDGKYADEENTEVGAPIAGVGNGYGRRPQRTPTSPGRAKSNPRDDDSLPAHAQPFSGMNDPFANPRENTPALNRRPSIGEAGTQLYGGSRIRQASPGSPPPQQSLGQPSYPPITQMPTPNMGDSSTQYYNNGASNIRQQSPEPIGPQRASSYPPLTQMSPPATAAQNTSREDYLAQLPYIPPIHSMSPAAPVPEVNHPFQQSGYSPFHTGYGQEDSYLTYRPPSPPSQGFNQGNSQYSPLPLPGSSQPLLPQNPQPTSPTHLQYPSNYHHQEGNSIGHSQYASAQQILPGDGSTNHSVSADSAPSPSYNDIIPPPHLTTGGPYAAASLKK